MNECLTTPQHEKQIGYWVSEKGKCMKWWMNECLMTPQHEKQIGYWVLEKGEIELKQDTLAMSLLDLFCGLPYSKC